MAVKISEKNLKVPFFAEDFCIFDYANYNPIIFLIFIENSAREKFQFCAREKLILTREKILKSVRKKKNCP